MLVSTHPDTLMFSDPLCHGARNVIIKNPKTMKLWQEHISHIGQGFIEDELGLSANAILKRGVFTIFLGAMGQHGAMRQGLLQIDVLRDTLIAIRKHFQDEIILLKPHAFTDVDLVRSMLSKNKFSKVFLTHLHPSILGYYSSLVFANHFTTAFLDAKIFKVKTILYTNFGEQVLKSTGGKSPREEIVDVFITSDPKAFDQFLSKEKMGGPGEGKPLIELNKNEFSGFVSETRKMLSL